MGQIQLANFINPANGLDPKGQNYLCQETEASSGHPPDSGNPASAPMRMGMPVNKALLKHRT